MKKIFMYFDITNNTREFNIANEISRGENMAQTLENGREKKKKNKQEIRK